MNSKKYILALGIISMGFILGKGQLNYENATKDDVFDDSKYQININNDGKTYGSNLINAEYGNEPDLILVEDENGKSGYVYKEDFYDTANQPQNPEEAIIYMENLKKNKVKRIPVYESDGKTVIGTFPIGDI